MLVCGLEGIMRGNTSQKKCRRCPFIFLYLKAIEIGKYGTLMITDTVIRCLTASARCFYGLKVTDPGSLG